jgi:hypothetical protein
MAWVVGRGGSMTDIDYHFNDLHPDRCGFDTVYGASAARCAKVDYLRKSRGRDVYVLQIAKTIRLGAFIFHLVI